MGHVQKPTLSDTFTYLVSAQQRNFYARLISSMVRVQKPGLGTMAVGIDKVGKFILFFDPEFIKNSSFYQLVMVCQHEVLHLLLGHIPRFLNVLSGLTDALEQAKFRSVMNVATDCAANELIRATPKFKDQPEYPYFMGCQENDFRGALLPDEFQLPVDESMELYLYTLLSKIEDHIDTAPDGSKLHTLAVPHEDQGRGPQGEITKGQTGMVSLDRIFENRTGNPHKTWEEALEGLSPEELQGIAEKVKQETRNIIRQAVSSIKDRGTVPGEVRDLIESWLRPPTIPWPEVLRALCQRTRQTKVGRGMARPSRRSHGIPGILPFPGRARDRKFTIAYALDTSGSMSTDDLQLALGELLGIACADSDVSITVMYCDSRLHITYDVKSPGDVDWGVVGRGGTDFNPPFLKIQELMHTDKAPDIFIYATDGFAPAPAPENRITIPVVWLLTPDGVVPSPDYGIHIRMEPFTK